jgi:uncharacterized membrane protein
VGLGLAPAAALLVAMVAHGAGLDPVGVVEAIGGPICHHDPARTLAIGGELLPVCARCTGLYAGAALGGVVGLGWRLNRVGALAFAATALTGLGFVAAVAEAAGWLATANGPRVVLGAALGVGVPGMCTFGGRLLIDAARR